MATDPSIILGIQRPSFLNPQQMLTLREFGQQMNDERLARQRAMAAQALWQRPDAVDPATGLPTIKTITELSKIDPAAAQSAVKNMATVNKERAGAAGEQQKLEEGKLGFLADQTQEMLNFWDGLGSNIPLDQRKLMATQEWSKRLDGMKASGQLSRLGFTEDEIARLPADFNYDRASTNLAYHKQRVEEADKARLRATEGKSVVTTQGPDGQPMISVVDKATGTVKTTGAKAVPKAADSGKPADQHTLEFLYDQYMVDPAGTLNSLGAGAGGTRLKQQLINYAAQRAQGGGANGTAVASTRQNVKAEGQALAQQEKKLAGVSANEEKASMQADLVEQNLGAMGHGFDTPYFQKLLVAGQRATGDTAAAKYYNSVLTFQEEYAKVMTGSVGAAAATDSARNKAEELLNAGQSPDQIRALVAQMKQEMKFATKSLQDSIDTERGKINKGAGGGAASGGYGHLWSE
jgi:hypothetical protein